ncbi:MAG: hypothetical protein R6U41_04795 [Desulfosalsimonas sp.]|uniref:hypothetical protein n=1 Tax=Desulfosalsimonas sp. TaxID=3073848 RepID=UPI00397075D7
MTDAVGPVFTGGFEEFVVNDEQGQQYTILYLPDRNNDHLQREGKPPVYYWVPGQVRLARFGDVGDFKFRHIHFVGVLDEQTHVGVEGRAEVVGGLLSFTTTSRYPTSVLQQAEQQVLAKFRGDDDRYWGWRSQAAPMFRIAPIRDNRTAITNLAPGADGTAPAENIPTTAGALTGVGGVGGASGGGASGGGVPPGRTRSLVRRADLNRKVIHGRAINRSTLDAWAWNLQGQGPGSVTGGENAYAGLIGQYPSELIWAGFKGGASPIVAAQHLILPMWSQEIWLKITGEWDRIFQHFSAHANARYLWFSADIKAEFNQLRINGDIQVEMAIDGTLPGAEKMQEQIDKRVDMVLQRFMDQATQRIFEPAPPEVKPAKASSGGIFSSIFGGGGGLALKYRRDEQHLNLHYEETRYQRYLQPTTISSSFEGFYNEIKDDPEAERKYFTRLIMGEIGRKVTRIVKPVVNWPDPAKDWVGEPAAFLSAEIGYPDHTGNKQWLSHVFQSTDTTDQSNWTPAFARREENEVSNAPADWKPDVAYVRRRVHLSEPMGMTDNPFVKVDVEKNVVDIDPEGGVATTDQILEVRADSVGKLEVGPIDIDVVLQDNTQVVTVEFKAEGRKIDGSERPVVKFQWNNDDQDDSRYWEIFTGQPDYVPRYKYRVSVNVKGTLFSAGMAWTGPWIEGQGNGPLMVHVPKPDDEGVRTRRLAPRALALEAPRVGEAVEDGQPAVPLPPGGEPEPAEPDVGAPPGGREVRARGEGGGETLSGYDFRGESRMSPPPGEEEPAGERTERSSNMTDRPADHGVLEELSGKNGWNQL